MNTTRSKGRSSGHRDYSRGSQPNRGSGNSRRGEKPRSQLSRKDAARNRKQSWKHHFVNLLRDSLKSGTFDQLHSIVMKTVEVETKRHWPRHVRRGIVTVSYEENFANIVAHAVEQGKLMNRDRYNEIVSRSERIADSYVTDSAKKTHV